MLLVSYLGITNHEEYSLIHEKGRQQTMRRPKNAPRDYDKLETLKQKLQTDDGGRLRNLFLILKSFYSELAISCENFPPIGH